MTRDLYDVTFMRQPDEQCEEMSEPIVEKTTQKVLELAGGEAAAVWVKEGEGKVILHSSWYRDGSLCPADQWPHGQSLCQLCQQRGILLLDDSIREELGIRFVLPGFGRNAFLCLPLRMGGQIIGAVTVSQPDHPTCWQETDLETLRVLARRLTFVVERIRIERGACNPRLFWDKISSDLSKDPYKGIA